MKQYNEKQKLFIDFLHYLRIKEYFVDCLRQRHAGETGSHSYHYKLDPPVLYNYLQHCEVLKTPLSSYLYLAFVWADFRGANWTIIDALWRDCCRVYENKKHETAYR